MQPVICEYTIQGEADPYPNVFILPKKYPSVRDVKIADVIRSMPLQPLGSDGLKMNTGGGKTSASMYSNLHFRFETYIVNPKTHKKIPVFKDIICNDGNLKELESIPCPIMKDQIKVKVLKMPDHPDVKRKLPRCNKQ